MTQDGVDTEGLGFSSELFEDQNESYYAKLFKNGETGDYMIAFRGTDDGADWKHNLAQGFGMKSAQYKSAMDLATTAAELVPPGSKLSFVGHSLGGGLASAASVVTGLPATTFNAAGLSPKTVTRFLQTEAMPSADQIDAYFVKGDLLSAVQDPFPDVLVKSSVGNRIPLSGSGISSPLNRHEMKTVGEAMGIVLNRGKPGMGSTIKAGD